MLKPAHANFLGSLVMLTGSLALPGAAAAQGDAPQVLMVRATDLADTARINREGRLRKTDEEFTNEQDTIACSAPGADGSMNCLQCGMRTGAIDGVEPEHRMQCACTPVQVKSDGAMIVSGVSRFVTDNDGNEYRNCNKPTVMAMSEGQRFLFMFNYQPNNTGDTRRYVKVLDAAANPIPVKDAQGRTRKQVQIMHKNNDDCDMHQDGEGPCDIASDVGGVAHLACWAGCNGNGRDNGWLNDFTADCSAGDSCTIRKNFDVSLCEHEERSRGRCEVAESDPNTAVCTWSEGNNQPQEDGVWIAGVDISAGGEQGEDAGSRLLWKERIEHRVDAGNGNRRYYARRIVSGPVLSIGPDGKPRSDGDMFISYTLHRGNNNNEEKGGTNYRTMAMVVKATRTGLTTIMPKTDITELMLGVDSTHVTFSPAIFGDAASATPGFTMLGCSHNGGLASVGQIKAIGYDRGANALVDLGTRSLGTGCDRHLYSNYLGNNPGNQGRNFQGTVMIPTPGAAADASKPAFSMIYAVSGKTAGAPGSEGMQFKPDEKAVQMWLRLPVATAGGALSSAEGAAGCSASSGALGGPDTLLILGGLAFIVVRRRRS